MKISASVPDDLWVEAAGDETSTSKVVQQGLEALVEHRRQSAHRVSSAETRLRGIYGVDEEPGEGVLDKLVQEAHSLQKAGYMLGVDLAARIGWQPLEELPIDVANCLRRWSRDELLDGLDAAMGNYEGFEDELVDLLRDYGQGLDPYGEPIGNTTFWDAIASGIADTRAAVRERLRNPVDNS